MSRIKQVVLEITDNEARKGRNAFEGRNTSRPYAILAKSRIFDMMVEHPRILRLLDSLLLPNYLITASQAINIHPGEDRQPYRFDDAFCAVPRPRSPFGVSAIWAIDDFTVHNGATVVFPKSHLWADD